MKNSSHVQQQTGQEQDSNIRVLKPNTGDCDIFREAPPLKELKQQFDGYLKKRLQVVFDAVDDTFFDLADKAESNGVQAVYFDAMRIIRMERKALEHRTLTSLDAAFRKLGDENWQGVSKENTGEPSLEVIENDELEEIIALDTMVSKCLENCKNELEQLNARINFLAPATVTSRNNPCSPIVICDAFGRAIEALDIDIRAKLVLLKLFDRHVVGGLVDFQQHSNQLLKEMGILPNLKLRRPHNRTGSAVQAQALHRAMQNRSAENTCESQETDPGANAAANYHRLMGLFGELFPPNEGSQASADGHGEASFEHILSSLSVLQNRLSHAKGAAQGRINLPRILERQMQLSQHTSAPLGGMDKGVIQLVDQLMDFYDQQTSFPRQISSLVQKLKAPVLRIALEDPAFFEQTDHPARQLLNRVAEVSSGLQDSPETKDDPVYGLIDNLVSKLTSLENIDQEALNTLLSEFMAKIDHSLRRVSVLEKRLLEQVSANEQNNQTHREVNGALSELMAGKNLPRSVVDLVEQAWCKVLFLTVMRHGKDSEQWQASLGTIEQLLALVEAEDRQQEQIDTVLNTVRQKLEDIAIDPYQLGVLVGGIEQFFEDQAELRKAVQNGMPTEQIPAQEQVVVEQLATQLPGEIEQEDEPDLMTIDEQDLEQADNLTRGSWIDLVDAPPQGTEANVKEAKVNKARCKLAGIINPPGKYIFVNRQGAKVAEKSRFQVALDIKNKLIVVRDKNDIFDRALDRVLSDIRQRKPH